MPIFPGRLWSCALALIFTLSTALTQRVGAQGPTSSPAPSARHSLGLEAHSVANGGKTQVTGSSGGLPVTDAFSIRTVSDRRVAGNRTNVEVNVRNFSRTPDRVRVEWFFVALPVGESSVAGNREIIFHQDSQLLDIPAGKTATQIVSSPEVQALYERSTTIVNIPASVYNGGYSSSSVAVTNQQRGLTIRGWMVRLVSEDGQILAAKGSSQSYEEIAANPSRLAGLLAFSGLPSPASPRDASR